MKIQVTLELDLTNWIEDNPDEKEWFLLMLKDGVSLEVHEVGDIIPARILSVGEFISGDE